MRGWGSGARVWPPTRLSLGALVLAACLAAAGIAAYRYLEVWTPLQRHYLGAYLWSGVALTRTAAYDVVYVIDPRGRRLAVDADLAIVTAPTRETAFVLSEAAVTSGATRVEWARDTYPHRPLHLFLRRWIYGDQTLMGLAQPVLWGAFALFFGGLLGARAQELMHVSAARDPYGASWAAPSVVRYVEATPRPSGLALPPEIRPGRQAQAMTAAPSGFPRAGLTVGQPTLPPASPGSEPDAWPDPLFK